MSKKPELNETEILQEELEQISGGYRGPLLTGTESTETVVINGRETNRPIA